MLNKTKFLDSVYILFLFFSLSFIFLLPNIFIFYIISLSLILYILYRISYQYLIFRHVMIKKENISLEIELLDNLKREYLAFNDTIESTISKLYRLSFSEEFLEKKIFISKLENEVFLLEKADAAIIYLEKVTAVETLFYKKLFLALNRKE